MKAVLMSIRPEWCEKIANGKKTIEVRKTRPKLETPFKVYIYCTKGYPMLWKDGSGVFSGGPSYKDYITSPHNLNGKIIGEFVCSKLERYVEINNGGLSKPQYMYSDEKHFLHALPLNRISMDYKAFAEYAAGRECYGWWISKLKIYERPEELYAVPPQSWYYVEGE